MAARPVYVIGTNHFDPVWRRGFRKPFWYGGEKYVAGEVIEEANLDEWLEMATRPGSTVCFEVESVLVLRNYLHKHPEALPVFRRLIREGRFELLACGEIIPDTNLPSGETLVRNLASGIWWSQEVLGFTPVVGNLNDAFGTSAQMPQIFRGCNVKWLMGLSYKYPSGRYWRGLDGTCIVHSATFPAVGNGKWWASGTYYRPCPACRGEGCPACSGYGFEVSLRMKAPFTAEGLDLDKDGFGVIYAGGEETLLHPSFPELLASAETMQGDVAFIPALHSRVMQEQFSDLISRVDNPPPEDIGAELEGNPIQTGCYVSRIKTKQQLRRLENRAIASEMASALAWLDSGIYPLAEFEEIWQLLAFASFHDNVTGTHVDAGYEELIEAYARCDALLDKVDKALGGGDYTFSPLGYGLPAAEASGWAEQPLDADAAGGSINNARYTLSYDGFGVYGILDRRRNRQMIDSRKGYAGELILENDFGDPWTTREEDRKRTRMGRMQRLTGIRTSAEGTQLVFTGKFAGNERLLEDPADYRVLRLNWESRVTLLKGDGPVRFETDLNWDCFDRRIRVSFPLRTQTDTGMYAVPYGRVLRKKYDKEARKGVGVADGDWPCTGYFAVAKNGEVQAALLNAGTPSSRIERGELLMSVLRSPTFPSCLFWPGCYNAPVYDGMRDRGQHSFRYAFMAYDEYDEVHRAARAFNAATLTGLARRLTLPALEAACSEITAIKLSQAGDGLAVRLHNYGGRQETVRLQLPAGISRVLRANLLEEAQGELAIKDGWVSLDLRPFDIVTLLLCKGGVGQ